MEWSTINSLTIRPRSPWRNATTAPMAAVLMPGKARSALQVPPYARKKAQNWLRAGQQVSVDILAANDVAAVHGGYEQHRKKLLKGGVHL
jgi:hypothetical protein